MPVSTSGHSASYSKLRGLAALAWLCPESPRVASLVAPVAGRLDLSLQAHVIEERAWPFLSSACSGVCASYTYVLRHLISQLIPKGMS